MSEMETNADEWVAAGDGVRRRILAHTPDMMSVQVEFQQNAIGAPHSHPHVQSVYVVSGRFDFEIDGKPVTLAAGQSAIVPPNAVHSCVNIEAGTLIDTFTPRRDDFL